MRYAAGLYWLLDMEQPGVPYRQPLCLNEVGADIFRLMMEGKSRRQIAEALGGKYQAPAEEILPDVELFEAQLAEYGILEATRER